jgi:hypothetical protein
MRGGITAGDREKHRRCDEESRASTTHALARLTNTALALTPGV